MFRAVLIFICAALWGGEQETLIVGMQLQDPPFEMVSESGKPVGISVEIAKALASFLGKELTIRGLPFLALIPALNNKEIDCIISSMSVTPQRLEAIDFSDPYLQTGLCLLISAKSNLQNIEGADEKGRVIAVKQGTTGEVYALSRLKKAKILSLSEEAACVLEVVQGKADAFIYDRFSIYAHSKNNPKTTRAVLKPFEKEDWAIGLRKGDPLKEKINLFLRQFLALGKMKQLLEPYYEGMAKK